MTTTFLATVSALAELAYEPLAAALHELAVAIGLGARGRVPGELDRDGLPAGSQLADRGGEPGIARIRRADGGPSRRMRSGALEVAQSPYGPGGAGGALRVVFGRCLLPVRSAGRSFAESTSYSSDSSSDPTPPCRQIARNTATWPTSRRAPETPHAASASTSSVW